MKVARASRALIANSQNQVQKAGVTRGSHDYDTKGTQSEKNYSADKADLGEVEFVGNRDIIGVHLGLGFADGFQVSVEENEA